LSILGCVFVGDHTEVKFGMLWSQSMAMITFGYFSIYLYSVTGGIVRFVYICFGWC